MPKGEDFAGMGNASVVAPAGYGKTELIAQIGRHNRRTLVLTHTHAGVHALRERLKHLGVSSRAVSVDTIAGWCTRYSRAFPVTTTAVQGTPRTPEEWDQLNRGVELAVKVPAIRDVVKHSYDQILIDEYQDCVPLQHQLAVTLSEIVPTLIFGDPMQGIFEFAGATLPWEGCIHDTFPVECILDIPYRWNVENPELGQWIAETREKLIAGDQINLRDSRINFKQSDDAFDMSVLFDDLEKKEGSIAAIHCNKGICYRLARASNGGFQAIEENAAKTLGEFATGWDAAANSEQRKIVLRALVSNCFNIHNLTAGETDPENVSEAIDRIQDATANLENPLNALVVIKQCRIVTRWKLYRAELWRDAERAINELLSGRVSNMTEAVDNLRQRSNILGRHLPRRTISTPLLLKGLEFSHVIVPHADHFQSENNAQAKLFYVAISRATSSLTISSSSGFLQFPKPSI